MYVKMYLCYTCVWASTTKCVHVYDTLCVCIECANACACACACACVCCVRACGHACICAPV